MRLYYFLYFVKSERYLVAEDFDWPLTTFNAGCNTYEEIFWDHQPNAVRAYEAYIRQLQEMGVAVPDMLLVLKTQASKTPIKSILLPMRKQSSKSRVVTFSEVEASHLLNLLDEAARRGEYYGPAKQYWARHQRILEKLSKPNEES
jgi:hypothetical protein